MSFFPQPSRRSVRRLSSIAVAFAALLVAAPALHADSITYNVTLSPTQGIYGGTGTLTVGAPPSTSGITTYSQKNGNLQGLSFVIDGQTFSLSPDSGAFVEFLNGKLYDITFAQTLGNYPNRFTLDTSGGYAFYYNQDDEGSAESAGNMTAALAQAADTPAATPSTPVTSATPEPASLVLLATVLLTGSFFIFRRKRAAQS